MYSPPFTSHARQVQLLGALRSQPQRMPVTAPKLTKRAEVTRNVRRTAPLSGRTMSRNATENGADVLMSAVGTCHMQARDYAHAGMRVPMHASSSRGTHSAMG